MYQIELRRRAQRALDRLPRTDFQAVIEAIKGLALTPRPRGVEKVRSTGLWRIRQGDYRIIYADIVYYWREIRIGSIERCQVLEISCYAV